MGNRAGSVGANGVPGAPDAISDTETRPRSVELAAGGIRTCGDVIVFSSALVGDVMVGSVKPGTANTALKAVNMMLVAAQLAHRHGKALTPSGDPDLVLCHEATLDERKARVRRELAEINAEAAMALA